MRHVISSGTAESILGTDLDGKRELSRARRRLVAPPVAPDAELACSGANVASDLLGVTALKIRTFGIERLVARQLVGPVTGECREEVLARARLEVEQVGPDPASACLPGGTDDSIELVGPVG